MYQYSGYKKNTTQGSRQQTEHDVDTVLVYYLLVIMATNSVERMRYNKQHAYTNYRATRRNIP